MWGIVAVIVAGGAGCLSRMLISLWCLERFGPAFPVGTLVVNVLGSFLMGVMAGLTRPESGIAVPAMVREGVMIGLLGGLTTFSSFAMQTLGLIQEGELGFAILNVVLSVSACLLVVWAGYSLVVIVSR